MENTKTKTNVYDADYQKQYYEANKDRIQAMLKEKVTCERCNKSVSHSHLNKHMKTDKCKRYTESFIKTQQIKSQITGKPEEETEPIEDDEVVENEDDNLVKCDNCWFHFNKDKLKRHQASKKCKNDGLKLIEQIQMLLNVCGKKGTVSGDNKLESLTHLTSE